MIELLESTLFKNIDITLFDCDRLHTFEFKVNDFEISVEVEVRYYKGNDIKYLETNMWCVLGETDIKIINSDELRNSIEKEINDKYNTDEN